MNRAKVELPVAQIKTALGKIRCPGSLDDFAAAMAQPWPNVMRHRRGINPATLPIPSTAVEWYSLGRRPVEPSTAPSRSVAYACNDFFVQDAGSLLALAVAGAAGEGLHGKTVCDLCAAPGGKASALVEAVATPEPEQSGFVLANEIIRSRVGPLQLNLARTGTDCFAISSLDPDTLADQLPQTFDLLVVDAPCSGQAMMSRGKQKLSALSHHQIQHSASRQRRILAAAVNLIRDGGQLIYSTCTFAEAENEAQIRWLIEQGIATPHPVDSLQDHETDPACYRCWPHLHRCAGSFAASLTINHGATTKASKHQRSKQGKTPVRLTDWYDETVSGSHLCTRDSVLLGLSPNAPAWVDQVAVSGPELAHRTGQTWKPAHAGALRRTAGLKPANTIDIDTPTCKQFMRGEPIQTAALGWNTIQLQGRPLGWVKADGRIGKNHLPNVARMSGELAS